MNKDFNKRDEILFGGYSEDAYKYGGIRHFEYLDVDTLKQLIDEGFIDPEECQNDSPTTMEFYEFMKKYPDFTAHGYAVSPVRSDYRITLEGIECSEPYTNETLRDFVELCRFADEFCVNQSYAYAWYD